MCVFFFFQAEDGIRDLVRSRGLGAVSGATVVRFLPRFRVGGERQDIEKLLGVLSVFGVAALATYFLTSDFGWEKSGLIALEPETGQRLRGVLTIVWVVLVLVATLPMLFALSLIHISEPPRPS